MEIVPHKFEDEGYCNASAPLPNHPRIWRRGASFDFVKFKGRLILISTILGRAFFSRRLFKWDLFSFSLPIKYIPKLKFRKRFSESNSNLKVKVQSQSQSPLPKSKSTPKVEVQSQSQSPIPKSKSNHKAEVQSQSQSPI